MSEARRREIRDRANEASARVTSAVGWMAMYARDVTELLDDAQALRCTDPACGEDQGDHFDHGLREKVAAAIREYPNTEAKWWVGPEAVLGIVEEYLGIQIDE